jgi:hypothetical protein
MMFDNWLELGPCLGRLEKAMENRVLKKKRTKKQKTKQTKPLEPWGGRATPRTHYGHPKFLLSFFS